MKKISRQTLFVFLFLYLIIFILVVSNTISYWSFLSTLYAGILVFINFAAAAFLYKLSIDKSNKIYLLFNLGGMGIRIAFLLISIVLVIKFLKIDKYAFILVLFIFYFVALIFELKYILTKKNVKK